MTVSATTNEITYTGDGVTTSFPIPFKFLRAADIRAVLIVTTDHTSTEWALTTNFTLSDPGNTGTLTALVAPTAGQKLRIMRDANFLQSTDYTENDAFPAETHETALDRVMMAVIDSVKGPAEAGHIRAGNIQIPDGVLTSDTLVVTSVVTESTWESVGQTGFGGDNEWAAMDLIPSNATILLVDLSITISPSSIAAGGIYIYAVAGDISTPTLNGARNLIANFEIDPDADTGAYVMQHRVMIPLDPTDQDFKIYWVTTNTDVNSITAYYRGFMTN